MEQVWTDLTSPPPISPQPENPSDNDNSDDDHVIVQDFFGLDHSSKHTSHCDLDEVPNLAPPQTSPSLNPGGFIASRNHDIISGPNCVTPPYYNFFDVVANNGIFSFSPNNYNYMNKKGLVVESCDGADLKHKRLMKNRESAARSRARKQAYTHELELEVARLAAENEKLKKQREEETDRSVMQLPDASRNSNSPQQKLSLAVAAQHSTKKTHRRASTAPF